MLPAFGFLLNPTETKVKQRHTISSRGFKLAEAFPKLLLLVPFWEGGLSARKVWTLPMLLGGKPLCDYACHGLQKKEKEENNNSKTENQVRGTLVCWFLSSK